MPISWGGAKGANRAAVLWQSHGVFGVLKPERPPRHGSQRPLSKGLRGRTKANHLHPGGDDPIDPEYSTSVGRGKHSDPGGQDVRVYVS